MRAVADAPPEEVAGGVLLRGRRVRLSSPVPVTRFYRHGWHSWSPTRWLDATRPVAIVTAAEARLTADDPVWATSPRHGGSGLGAVDCADGTVLLLGALGLGARVEAEADALAGSSELDDAVWFAACGPEEDVFARYADLLGERLGSRPRRPGPRMWSSWYSLYGEISEPVLRDVLRDVGDLDLDLFQVDDGWQQAVGDWEANDRFPSGMGVLADAVRAAGLEPGLWLAPFVAGHGSRLLAERPEALLRDDAGAPVKAGHNWGGDYYALDVTAPAARDHVAAAIRRVVGWGYRYLKLDFLYAAALPGRRAEDVHREVAYRRALELVRETAGDDVYLLVCGAPVLASLGLADGIRVGPDVAPWWELPPVTRYLHDLAGPATRYAVATSLHRLWLGRVLDTDPDVAYFGGCRTLLTAAQRSLLIDLCRVADFRGTSDLPRTLTADEGDAAAAFFRERPPVVRLDRYRFRVGDREVDFGPVAAAEPDFGPG